MKTRCIAHGRRSSHGCRGYRFSLDESLKHAVDIITTAMPETMLTHRDRPAQVKRMIAQIMRGNAGRLAGRRTFLFGSRAAGRARAHSDFDIGVMGDSPLPLQDFYAIEDQLDDLPTLYKIDWVDFNRASERFQQIALRDVEPIHD
jgi:predicted nucleotidyltransferase